MGFFNIPEREVLQNRITELEARDRDRKIELEARELLIEQVNNRIAELQKQNAEQANPTSEVEAKPISEVESDVEEPKSVGIELYVWCKPDCGFKGEVHTDWAVWDYRWQCPECFSHHIVSTRGDRGDPFCKKWRH